jgi:phospholipid/cholesterol/gamma-HCH transport system permease protein
VITAVGRVGAATRARAVALVELAVLLGVTLRALGRRPLEGIAELRALTARQIVFTGWDAIPLIALIALSIGVVVVMQAATFLPELGGEALIGRILVLVVLKELGPMLAAFVVIGRSGAAMTIELGYMQVQGEVEALVTMGIDPLKLLVAPRILGGALSVLCLTVVFDVVALLGGFAFATFAGRSFGSLVANLVGAMAPRDLAVGAAKAVAFGVIIATVACREGLSVRRSITEVPQATIRAVVGSLFYCMATSVVLTVLAL